MTPEQIEDTASELCDSGNPEAGWSLRGANDSHHGIGPDPHVTPDHEYHDDYQHGYQHPGSVFARHNITPDEV